VCLLNRSTTTYLVQRRIDMLPKPLTEDICSLRADVERLAFSVLWEMTPDACTVGVRFTKSVIRSGHNACSTRSPWKGTCHGHH
jgi:exosome complex exonuclease DIS3/RRP44